MSRLVNQSISAEIEEIAGAVRPSVVLIETRNGHGSGVVWSTDGWVVSNHHVAPTGSAWIELADGRTVRGTVVRSDPVADLSLLQIDRPELATIALRPATIGDDTQLRVGDLVIAIGNPLGVRGSAALGMVSGVGNVTWMGRTRRDVLQADIKLAPGNSGGPIVNIAGEVVGIASMVMSPGIAIAVPSRVARRFVGGREGFEERGPNPEQRRTVVRIA